MLSLISAITVIIAIITIILTAPTTSATGTIENSTGLNLSVNISQVMAIRTLDATATSDIASLNFAITPTPAGVRQTNTTIVDVATSNVSGYKLMMNSDYRTDGTSSDTPSAAEFTTSLINTDSAIAATEVGQITTTAGSSTASSTSYWNYSKSWNETLGPEGYTKSFSSTTLADTINPSTNQPYGTTILENLAIPAQSTPDTVRDDVDMATSSSQTSISVNVNAATDKSSGIYKNELVFTAIANPIPVDYTLTFNKNTEDTVANLPDPLTNTATATSYGFTIPDTSGEGTLPAMTRTGYQFVGWSTSASSRQGSGSGPDGLYIAGDTYTVVADDSGNPDYTTHGTGSATLYAFWEQAGPAFWTITTMQQMTPEVCASVYTPNNTTSTSNANMITREKYLAGQYTATSDGTSPQVPETTLIDDRDADGTGTKRSYTVRKLADGNCWMTENLKYDLRGLYNNGKRGIGSKNDGSTFEMTDANLRSGVSYYTTSNDQYDYVITPNTNSKSVTRNNAQIGNTTGVEYYYTWSGATAGQGGANDSSSGTAINGSICPAGWRLPTYNGTYSYQTLYNSYNNVTKWEQYPATFLRVGFFNSGSQTGASYGYYWSASVSNANVAYNVYYGTSRVGPQDYSGKSHGFSVRCVANR